MNKAVIGTIVGAALLGLAKKGSAARKFNLIDTLDKIVITVQSTYKRPYVNLHYDTYQFYGVGEHLENVISSFNKETYQDIFVNICEEREEDIKEAIADGLGLEEGSPDYQLAIATYEAGKARVRDNRRIDPTGDLIKFYKDTIPKDSDILQEITEQAREKMFSMLNETMGYHSSWDQEAEGMLGPDFDFEDECPYPTSITWEDSRALDDDREDIDDEWQFDDAHNTLLIIDFTFSMDDLKERYSPKEIMEIIAWKNNWSYSRRAIEQIVDTILEMAHTANVNQKGAYGRGLKFDDKGGFEETSYSVSFGKPKQMKSKLRIR